MSSVENNSPDGSLSFHSAPVYGGTHFVGSPGQTFFGEPSTPPIRPIPSFGSLPSSSQRPNLQRRSFSHTTASPQTLPPVNPPQSLGESFRASLSRPTPQPQWSLFEQLMENEGQLTSPRQRARRFTVNSHRSQLSSPGSPISEATSTSVDPSHSVLQSSVHGHRDLLVSVDLEETNGYTSDSDSEDESQANQASSDGSLMTATPPPAPPHRFLPFQVPTIPVLWRNVLKCAVAYFLASLFTFSPYLSGFLSDISSPGGGPSPTGHMIASM